MINPRSSRTEAKYVLVAMIITLAIFAIAGGQAGITKAQKHLEYCADHPKDTECK